MAKVKIRLAEAMETSLITLHGKAVDARRTPSILGDTMAVRAVEEVDYDFGRLKLSKAVTRNAAARAKHFDDWTSEFLAAHERATVVHLGAGLDTRVFRINPGPNVTWYDVDHPEVIEVRRKLFPDRERYHQIGSSVTAPEWLQRIPDDSPTLVVAEGLSMYLAPEEGYTLVRRITERFPSGVLCLDTHNRLSIRMVNRKLPSSTGVSLLRWAIEHSSELERAVPGLRCTDAVSALSAPSTKSLSRSMRVFAALTHSVPALRNLALYLRYEFGPAVDR